MDHTLTALGHPSDGSAQVPVGDHRQCGAGHGVGRDDRCADRRPDGVPIAAQAPPDFDPTWEIWPTAAAPAHCRASDRVETGLQGEVPLEDRISGRSTEGYNCNLDLVGRYQGEGGGWVSATYKNCSYTGSTWPTNLLRPDAGVQVIDAADPRKPALSDVLVEPAMIGGTWESLKVNQKQGLLVGTGVDIFESAGFISVYDIAEDCAHPKLLNTQLGTQFNMPMRIIAHEGDFAPDGNTYYTSASIPGYLVAVDLTDPSDPMKVWSQVIGPTGHGLGFSPDGRTLYYATTFGLNVVDVSAVQNREPRTVVADRVPKLDETHFADGQFTQHNIYVTYHGKPFVYTVMESGSSPASGSSISAILNAPSRSRMTTRPRRSASGGSCTTRCTRYWARSSRRRCWTPSQLPVPCYRTTPHPTA